MTQWDGGGSPRVTWSHLDYGLLSTSVAVDAANCRPSVTSPNRVNLPTCMFVDVDKHATLSPAVHGILVMGSPEDAKGSGGLKGTLREEWVTVRDGDGFKVGRTEDSILDRRLRRDATEVPLRFADDTRSTPASAASPTWGRARSPSWTWSRGARS